MTDAMIKMHPLGATAEPGTPLEEFDIWLQVLIEQHRAINWRIGDLVNAVQRQYPPVWEQALPLGVSPDMISRYKAVSAAYKLDDRNAEATWSIHQQNSKNPDRLALVQAHVEAGHTSDEARKTVVTPVPAAVPEEPATPTEVAKEAPRWLVCVDISYYVHAGFEKHGLSTAGEVAAWLERTIVRLHAMGVTDFVCCFDGRDNHRKSLTAHWEETRRYKFKRADKEQELKDQMRLMPDLLARNNRPCVFIDTMEADDVMASYAAQFDGRVTMLTKDKDMRQCLKSKKVNMLTDVTWETNAETGVLMPVYHYVNAKKHFKEGLTYQGTAVSGITPELWPHFQALAGDSGDNIQGVKGIGAKGAMDLIRHHGTVKGVIDACKAGTATVFEKEGNDKPLSKILTQAVLEFEPLAEVMLQLTTLRTDLVVPMVTRLSMKE